VCPPTNAARGPASPSPARFGTLLDLAADADLHSLERALQQAEAGWLTDAIGLEQLIARYPGRRGVARLRVAVDGLGRGAGITRSVLEDRFLRFVAERGLPQPETNMLVPTAERRYEVDCLWHPQRLIVELDGRGFHDNGHAFHRDRVRLRALTAAGWRALPVTWLDLEDRPTGLASEIRSLLARVA
jgi:GNAT superfamily N-acetyltransferase